FNPAHVGDHLVKIPGVIDTRRQGILLANHAQNEDNFALVQPTNDGQGFNVTTRSNSTDGGAAESKPFSFVFVPLGTPNVTMASIYGSAGPTLDPTALISSGSNFSITRVTSPALVNGNYRLTIDGETPSSGVLVVQGGGNYDGDGGNPGDNIVTYRPDGDGWVIVSDDLPSVNHTAGQAMDPLDREPYFHFVFMPFDAPASAPGALPALNWDKSSVLAYDTTVTETDGTINGTATAHGMDVDVNNGTPGVNYRAIRQNRGDNSIHIDGVIPAETEGIMLSTVSEGLRDNSATGGGAAEFGVATAGLSGSPGAWEVHTHKASPAGNEEFNVNFAMVFFGADSGFTLGDRVLTDLSGNGHLDVTLSGVDSATDGVLMANPHGNFARVASVKVDGAGWDVDVQSTGLLAPGFPGTPPTTVPAAVDYVFLPYDTENLVAGRVNADGSVINSTGVGTNPGEFTLTKDATGQYLLTVAGRTPAQGMLLLNAAAGADSIADNTMAYEAEGNAFRIFGIDMITLTERDLGGFTSFEDTAFSFAFIDYVTPPEAPGGGNFLEADFNQNGVVDGNDLTAWKGGFGTGTTKAQGDADADGDVDGSDFLTWQRQLGTLPPATVAAGAVPEPHTALLALLAGAALIGCGRRKS
ncbi:MAG: hypothetical protein H0T51_10030, partial [Pirellulales bacterium]|nr:hypothetical protein [Pirellulales bacterium]